MRMSLEAHASICPAVVVLCRYGCEARLPREKMTEHAQSCPALGQPGKYPRCDGYCCRRCPLHFDIFLETKRKGRLQQWPPSASAAKKVMRKEWMMMAPVSDAWK